MFDSKNPANHKTGKLCCNLLKSLAVDENCPFRKLFFRAKEIDARLYPLGSHTYMYYYVL